MIVCHGLVKYFGRNRVLNELNFHVNEGEVFGLLGPNGAGKTTAIKAILGLTKLNAGFVRINKDAKIGYSPETPYFHGFLSAFEVMIFYGRVQKIPSESLLAQIEKSLKTVGLNTHKDKKVCKFSKGMLQRLALAQALLGEPEILILDEPSAGLDALGRIEIRKLILKLKHEGRTILLNSHILSDVQSVADRVLIIKDGAGLKEVDLKNDSEALDLEQIFVESLGGGNLCISSQ